MALRKPKLEVDFTDQLTKLRISHEVKLIKYWRSLYGFYDIPITVSYEKVHNYSIDIYTVRIDGFIVLRRFVQDIFNSYIKWRYELYNLNCEVLK